MAAGPDLSPEIFYIEVPSHLGAVVRGTLQSTAADKSRSIYDVLHNTMVAIAHPPLLAIETVDGERRFMPLDVVRGWLDPESAITTAKALLSFRVSEGSETVEYEAVYRPPHADPFRLKFACRPLLRQTDGMVWLIVCDVDASFA